MTRNIRTTLFACLVAFSLSVLPAVPEANPGEMALLQGYDAFRNEDWVSALFFFRRAVAVADATEETWYMLILSEMFAEDYHAAVSDCDAFVSRFPSGTYYPLALYQKARALYHLGSYDESVALFTEFCHLYPGHEMYASALFWIAEAFFSEYNYSAAKVLYERIVADFPRDAKSVDAQARLRTIGQSEREEKLLYLLKVTGEEYLASREEYERQLRRYQSEDSIGLHDQLLRKDEELERLQLTVGEMEARNLELEKRVQELEGQNRDLQLSAEEARRVAADVAVAAGKSVRDAEEALSRQKEEAAASGNADSAAARQSDSAGSKDVSVPKASSGGYPEIEELKRKAAELQRLLEQKSVGGEK